jgi:hypothetical protein
MRDIYFGIGLLSGVSILLLIVGLGLGKRLSRRWSLMLIAALVLFMLIFGTVLLDTPRMVRLLPVVNVLIIGNWQLPATGLLIGLAWCILPGVPIRKLVLILPLAGLGLWRSYGPLLGDAPQNIRNRWRDGVCLQSSSSSCSAAAAATLLKEVGIDATEREMAELCFTREQGTTFHGLYRGLKLKTSQTTWDVQVLRGTVEELRESSRPVLLSVGLPRNTAGIDPRYHRDWGWVPGFRHSVVVFRFLPNEQIEVGDPAIGRERWGVEGLDVLWNGKGLRLVPRAE